MRNVGGRMLVLGVAVLAAAGAASAAGSLDLHDAGDLYEGVGQSDTKPLRAGATYGASAFAVSVKIRPPDALWEGVQHESGKYRFVQLMHKHASGTAPLTGTGYITLESATVATPSAAKTFANLRATPHMKIGPTKAVRVAGLHGRMFDATITGVDVTKYCKANESLCSPGISLEPFMTNHHCGFCENTMHHETQDVKFAGAGQVFRVIVLNAHGKVVVIYIESVYAGTTAEARKKFPTAKLFPTFFRLHRRCSRGSRSGDPGADRERPFPVGSGVILRSTGAAVRGYAREHTGAARSQTRGGKERLPSVRLAVAHDLDACQNIRKSPAKRVQSLRLYRAAPSIR